MKIAVAVAGALSAACLTACGGPGGVAGAAKAGAPAPAVRIVIADSQPASASSGLAVTGFASEVSRLSHGQMVVEVRAAGDFGGNHGEAKVVAALTSGEVQLAVVPTRAWSDAGVRSTDVLQAPFEVLSNAHMVAVAQDQELASRALDGLAAQGAHGIVLVPEALRMLVGHGDPVLHPRDLQGRFRSLSSTVGSLAADLGATVFNPSDDEYAAMIAAHEVRATETSWARAIAIASSTTVSADLILYAKFVSLAANADWWDDLTDEQREWLTTAATTARDNSAATLPSTVEVARAYCSSGGKIVLAGAAAVQEFKQALSGRTDALDAETLAMLRADRPATGEEVPGPCTAAPEVPDADAVTPEGGALPDGVYRLQWTEVFAREWNATTTGLRFENGDAVGSFRVITITWTLDRGHYTFEIVHDGGREGEPFVTRGIYQVGGDELLLALGPDIGNVVNRLRWSVGSDGSLTMTQLDELPEDPYYAVPWTRLGDD